MQAITNCNQYSLLIWMLLSHIIADFFLQNKWMTDRKSFLGWGMLLHVAIVIVITGLFTQLWLMALFIGIAHYFIDAIKQIVLKKYSKYELYCFITDQILHIAVLVLAWIIIVATPCVVFHKIAITLSAPKYSLIILAYALCIWPWSYLTGITARGLIKSNNQKDKEDSEEAIPKGGKLIGIFERIIILTFVLLQQYEAIGFLIAGKSLLRLNSKKQTEYVLAGTLLSYALAIITGVVINYLLHLL